MSRDAAIRVDGLRELRRALNQMEKGAPKQLNAALKEAAEPVELVASSRAPRDQGGIQTSGRVATRGDRLIFRNTQPYANAVHWGRKQWPRTGHPRAVPSVVKPNPWLYDAVIDQSDVIVRVIRDEVDRWMAQTVRTA